MDLWDLTTLMVRRWYFSLPLLLVSVSAVLVAAQGVKPDYKALGHLQLMPPPGLGKVDPEKPRPNNPWLDLGYNSLGNAAVLKVTGDQASLEDLKQHGFSDSVTITMNERSPLLEIEVIGESPQQATTTVQEVIRRLNADIADEQARYKIEQIDVITTLTLSDGSNVSEETSKVKRVLVVAAGLGLLTTIAGTVAFDALLRRRWRRKRGLDPSNPDVPPPANGSVMVGRDGVSYPRPSPVLMLPAATVGRPVRTRQFNGESIYVAEGAERDDRAQAERTHAQAERTHAQAERTQWLDAENEPTAPLRIDAHPAEDARVGIDVAGRDGRATGAEDADAQAAADLDGSSLTRHDSTIVLPLQLSFPGSRKKRRR